MVSREAIKTSNNLRGSPTIKFLKGKGTHLVEEWSKVRSPTFTRLYSTVLVNPNIKEYKIKSDILTVDWTNALKWDRKRHKIVKLEKRSNIYYTSDTIQNLDHSKPA